MIAMHAISWVFSSIYFFAGDLDELPDELEFSTMKTAGPASDPLHHNQKLKWDHKVWWFKLIVVFT